MKNSHLTLIIVGMCGLIPLSAEAQQRRRSSSPPKRTATRQMTPLQAFIGATGELNRIWRVTDVVDTPNEAIEMTTTILNLAVTSLADNEELRNLVSKTGEAYLDALVLRSMRFEAKSMATPITEESYRKQRVAEVQSLKDKYYREYDDPIARQANEARWRLMESLLMLEHSRGTLSRDAEERERGRRDALDKLQSDAEAVLLKHGIHEKYSLLAGQAENVIFEVAKTKRLEVIKKSGGGLKVTRMSVLRDLLDA